MTKKIALEVSERLIEEYPNPKPALKFNTPYELLVAVILSAQCTDERVNKVTAELFKVADTPEKMVALGAEELEKYIFSCGLYRSKAEHIISASELIVRDYGGKVPENIEDLRKLGGVGRKTANVVASVAFGQACKRENPARNGVETDENSAEKSVEQNAPRAYLSRQANVQGA